MRDHRWSDLPQSRSSRRGPDGLAADEYTNHRSATNDCVSVVFEALLGLPDATVVLRVCGSPATPPRAVVLLHDDTRTFRTRWLAR